MDVYLYGGVTIKAEGGRKAVSGKSWSFHWQDQVEKRRHFPKKTNREIHCLVFQVWRHQPDMMYPRQGHDCISYLVNGGETSVALIVGGVNTEADAGNGVLPSEIFDFALGRFVEGPPLQQGDGEEAASVVAVVVAVAVARDLTVSFLLLLFQLLHFFPLSLLLPGVLHPKLVWVGEHIYLVGGVPADSSKESGGDLQGQTAVQVLEVDHWRITEINMKVG